MLARVLDGTSLRSTSDLVEICAAVEAGQRIWIDLERQTAEADVLLADVLHLHALTIEDIWAPRSHPKIEDYDGYLYAIVHGIVAKTREQLELVEIEVVIGPSWLVTYDPDGLVTDDLGTEIDRSPRLMAKGVAWLAHAVLDRAVDRYLPVLDQLDDEIEQLEADVLSKAGTPRGKHVLARLLAFKRTLHGVRRMSAHQREILLRLSRGDFDEIPADAIPFFRDVYDHFQRVNDIVEGYRDLVASALDAYLSVQSNRMNDVIKTLTLISTVMLPLTFVVGLYGMNFRPEAGGLNMPELTWAYGYPFVLGMMAVITLGIVWWFRRKGWIGVHARARPEDDDAST